MNNKLKIQLIDKGEREMNKITVIDWDCQQKIWHKRERELQDLKKRGLAERGQHGIGMGTDAAGRVFEFRYWTEREILFKFENVNHLRFSTAMSEGWSIE